MFWILGGWLSSGMLSLVWAEVLETLLDLVADERDCSEGGLTLSN